LNANDCDI